MIKRSPELVEDEYAFPIPKFERTNTQKQQSFDNMGYTGHENGHHSNDESRGEDMYCKQLELFLNQAPSLTRNGITMETPRSFDKGSNKSNSKAGTMNDDNDYVSDEDISYAEDEDDVSEEGAGYTTLVPSSFSPAVHKQKEIQSKIIDRGPSWHQLSIMSS